MDFTEHPGVPQRPPASAQFNVNTIDRLATAAQPVAQYAQITTPGSGTPASNFQYSLTRPLLSGYFTRLAVAQALVEWDIPTITTGVNDTLIIIDVSNNQTYNAVIPNGWYNAYSLAAAIQTSIQAAATTAGFPWAVTVTFNPAAGALVFTSPNAGRFLKFGKPSNSNIAALNLYYMLGIPYGSTLISFQSRTMGPLRLIYTSYIDVISNKLCQYMKVKDSETAILADTAVLCRIYLQPLNQSRSFDLSGNNTGSQPFVLTFDPNTPKHIRWDASQYIYDFDIQVKDEFGNYLPWGTFYNTTPAASNQVRPFFELLLNIYASET